MDIKIIEILMNNGIGAGVAGFILWFVIRPLVTVQVKAYTEMSASLKEMSSAMTNDRTKCYELLSKLADKIEASEKKLLEEIKDLQK
ncbi:MAG: hypothetical protein HOP11_09565 [Saprospiraceae bacterium]|nr:hypothetical protein [Saprospiraceae bacterium]